LPSAAMASSDDDTGALAETYVNEIIERALAGEEAEVVVTEAVAVAEAVAEAEAVATEVVEKVIDEAAKAEEAEDPSMKIAATAGSLLAVMDLNDTMVFPFLADFFLNRGVTQGAVGMAFAALSVGMLIFALLMPKIMPIVGGPARTLGSGLALFGITRFLTAALPIFGTGTPLLSASLFVFFLQGCVYAFSEVGALTWVLYTAPPGKKTSAIGALTAARMMGGLLGTPVGGILFDVIGWVPTNILGGILLILPLYFVYDEVVKPIEALATESESGKQLWDMPKFAVVIGVNLIGLTITYAPVPFVQPFFKSSYGIGLSLFGIIFAVITFVSFGGGAALAPTMEEKFGSVDTIWVGIGIVTFGFLLIGPSPILWFLQGTGLWEGVLAFLLTFLGNSLIIISSPNWGLKMAAFYGLSEEEASVKTASYAIVSMAISQSLGPVPGAVLAHSFGVPWACTLLGLGGLGCIAALLKYYDNIVKAEAPEMM